jgi:hypothetical protein
VPHLGQVEQICGRGDPSPFPPAFVRNQRWCLTCYIRDNFVSANQPTLCGDRPRHEERPHIQLKGQGGGGTRERCHLSLPPRRVYCRGYPGKRIILEHRKELTE